MTRTFRFEVGATIGFVVEAETEKDAREKADSVCDELASHEFDDVPYDGYVAINASPPDFIGERR